MFWGSFEGVLGCFRMFFNVFFIMFWDVLGSLCVCFFKFLEVLGHFGTL